MKNGAEIRITFSWSIGGGKVGWVDRLWVNRCVHKFQDRFAEYWERSENQIQYLQIKVFVGLLEYRKVIQNASVDNCSRCLPKYINAPDWFRLKRESDKVSCNSQEFTQHLKGQTDDEATILKAISEVIEEQKQLGIDLVSDGEIRRENYVHYFCRNMKGFDFEKSTKMSSRNGATVMYVPTVRGKVEALHDTAWCVEDWRKSQTLTDTPLKYTIPGPMTIADSTANVFYKDHKEQLCDLRDVINREVRALAEGGCKYIQIDEPLLVRKPDIALQYGLDILTQCFQGVGEGVEKIVHLCCGYPNYLDQEDYEKADKMCYIQIAEKLDSCGFDAVSIEDAHRRNDLVLFDKLKKVKIILGSVTIARSKVESVEEIRARLQDVLHHVPPHRLLVAPDCGLGYLPMDILKQKLTNMAAAAKSLP